MTDAPQDSSIEMRYVERCRALLDAVKIELASGKNSLILSNVFIDDMLKMRVMSKDENFPYSTDITIICNAISEFVGRSPWKIHFNTAISNRKNELAAADKARIAAARGPRRNLRFEDCKQGEYVAYDKDDKPLPTVLNAQLVLRDLGFVGSYNIFTTKKLLVLNGTCVDTSTTGIVFNMMYDLVFVEFSDKTIERAIDSYCKRFPFHPIKDYFESVRNLENKNVIETWLTTVFGAENNLVNREIGKKMLVAMVARIYVPGTKFDEMPVFESSQGVGKSKALQILVGQDYYSNGDIFTATKAQKAEWLKGRMLFEAAELSGHSKAEVNAVKDFLSTTSDNVRGAYKHDVEDNLRTCIVVGTTNPDKYLTDETGNRRFWPVKCCVVPTETIEEGLHRPQEANINWLRQNRDQLFSEALRLYEEGYSLILSRDLWPEVAKLQQNRMIESAYNDNIMEIFGLSHNEGLNVIDDAEHHYLDLRIFTIDIIEHLFQNQQLASASKQLKFALNSLVVCDCLKWESKPMRIGKTAMLRGYQLIVTEKEHYDEVKLIMETMKARRGSRINDATL